MARLTENFKRLEEMGKLNRYHMGIIEDSLKEYEKEIRAKTIDEFAERLKADTMAKTFGLRICDIDRIAEEMRGGTE